MPFHFWTLNIERDNVRCYKKRFDDLTGYRHSIKRADPCLVSLSLPAMELHKRTDYLKSITIAKVKQQKQQSNTAYRVQLFKRIQSYRYWWQSFKKIHLITFQPILNREKKTKNEELWAVYMSYRYYINIWNECKILRRRINIFECHAYRSNACLNSSYCFQLARRSHDITSDFKPLNEAVDIRNEKYDGISKMVKLSKVM